MSPTSDINIKELISELTKANLAQTQELVRTMMAEARRPAPENNKVGYEQVIFALQEAELPTGIQTIGESLEEGVKRGVINEADQALAHAYISAHRKEIADFEQSMADRAATALAVLEKKKNERWFQEHGCKHEHPKAAGGGTHCVFVKDNDVPQSPGFIICQKCQGRFRPDEPLMRGKPVIDKKTGKPRLSDSGQVIYAGGLDPEAIFDTNLFNQLLQDCLQTGAEMLG